LNLQKDWSNISRVMADFRNCIIIRTSCLFSSFSVPSFLVIIWALWSNETGKGSLSKVVQRIRNYLQLNFQKDWSSTSEVMADIRDGIIIRTSFLFASFSVPSFLGVIWALSSMSRVMANFCNGIIIIICTYQKS